MYKKEDLLGARVTALGMTFEIAEVIGNFEWYSDWGFNIEFLDPKGNYHHWKQWDDGGEIKLKKRKLVNYHGFDCTDLFEKYGML